MNTITKIALLQYIMNLEIDKHKGWVQYILMDAAYITYNDVDYPYKGDLSDRFIEFAAGLKRGTYRNRRKVERVRKDQLLQKIKFPIKG